MSQDDWEADQAERAAQNEAARDRRIAREQAVRDAAQAQRKAERDANATAVVAVYRAQVRAAFSGTTAQFETAWPVVQRVETAPPRARPELR